MLPRWAWAIGWGVVAIVAGGLAVELASDLTYENLDGSHFDGAGLAVAALAAVVAGLAAWRCWRAVHRMN
jgi:hypothetical protein